MPTAQKLTVREKALVAYIRRHQPVSINQLSAAFDMNAKTLSVHVQNLRCKGVIFNDGAGRYSKWTTFAPAPKPPAPPKAQKPLNAPPPPKPEPQAIEQVSSIWHWAERHARAA